MILSARRILLSLLLIFNLSTLFAEPQNLGLLKDELVQYHNDGQYEKEFNEVIRQAECYIKKRAAQNRQMQNRKKLALVLDIDETSLSNYPNLEKHGFAVSTAAFRKSVFKARATAFPGMLHLYNLAQKNNITVFFVTGRRTSERQPTELNLHRAGYNHWGALFLKPNDYKESSVIPFKSGTRRAIEAKGYTIVATIGDQYSDLKGGFAEKGFKLPNPYYFLP
ncbi:HAD family acid phosphatase [Legionella genomosp. 1]|uniref:HAD family acid phosphatase n=1 Tax=Legionella genomosp. 1 TaxID=1093625 RepID=UPI0010564D7E|nr:HAD family acid phosphatase [Legionella genomosp. 1]